MSDLKNKQSKDYQIIRVSTQNEIDIVRRLFLEYQNEIEADLCFQSFDKELKSLPDKYTNPEGELLLIMDLRNNEYVGCVGLKKLRGNHCEMKRLFVKPKYRSKKYGFVLANEILNIAKEIGYSEIWLDTLDKLKAAIGLYTKLGFEETNSYYDNPLEGVVYMKKALNCK
jgi:putative acetyltransferase